MPHTVNRSPFSGRTLTTLRGGTGDLTACERAESDSLYETLGERIDSMGIPSALDWSNIKRGTLSRPAKREISLRFNADVSN